MTGGVAGRRLEPDFGGQPVIHFDQIDKPRFEDRSDRIVHNTAVQFARIGNVPIFIFLATDQVASVRKSR